MNDDTRLWTRGDAITAAVAGLISFALYVWTVAPNVTLLDSGEFIVAAQHFGVPHPTGYPLWTLLAWIFQLLPLGNAAWEINLFSAVCGGLAVAVATLLTRSSLRWLFADDLARFHGLATTIALTSGLLLAFSFSMWSQAVIAEVYTLHALIIGLFLITIYAWLRTPDRLWLLMLSFFLLALAFSNHHLSVVMAPIPFLAVLLVRRGIFWDLLLASLLTALLAYLGFAILSGNPVILKTAMRFFYCVAAGLIVLVVVRRFDLEWRLIAYLPFVVALGLLPYAYMPIASSTNPPMNWAYTSTPEGFYFSFNRSQYGGSLSDQSLRSVGRLVGTSGHPGSPSNQAAPTDPEKRGIGETLQEWTGFFWLQLSRSFTPLGVIAYFTALLVILRLRDVRRRTWVYLLEIAFVLAAILQPAADGAQTDAAGWWLQMPYHTYTNLIFALLAAIGLAVGATWLFGRFPRIARARFLLLALPILPLFLNYNECSQRDRWFGWQFGHDMLKDLPENSVVFGGTDPGRFVPTYMILGESTQPPSLKRDPDFDRRDLFIITQNGVGEPLYRKYIADHYGKGRPGPRNAFEHWLGRGGQYPAQTLDLPTEAEIDASAKAELEKRGESVNVEPTFLHSLVTRLIWEKNRDKHDFFVEESFALDWSYDHALPHGLIYRINKDPLKEIPADVVAKDMAFWRDYTETLINDPLFVTDFDAQRSFSKLRSTTGALYKHRKMDKEAGIAYRQALLLWPGNPDALNFLTSTLWERGANDEVIEIVTHANATDPNNLQLWRLRAIAEKRAEVSGEINETKAKLEANPADADATRHLLGLYAMFGDTNQISGLLTTAIPRFKGNASFLREAATSASVNNLIPHLVSAAKGVADADPSNAESWILVTAAAIRSDDKPLFLEAAAQALKTGGLPTRETLRTAPDFSRWREDADVRALLGLPPPTPTPTPQE